jgi:hypothetical protein
MERIALMMQRADGVYHAGKGCTDAADNKGRGVTSQAQAFLFGWEPSDIFLLQKEETRVDL